MWLDHVLTAKVQAECHCHFERTLATPFGAGGEQGMRAARLAAERGWRSNGTSNV